MSHKIKKVEHLNNYKLKLHFDDKTIKVVNLESMLKTGKNLLLDLVDIAYFKQVKCDGFTICWPNGVDLCPDVLYRMGTTVKTSSLNSKKENPKAKIRKKTKVKSS